MALSKLSIEMNDMVDGNYRFASDDLARWNAIYDGTEGWIDDLLDQAVSIDGSVDMAGTLDMGGNKIINLKDPSNDADLATKAYVDTYAGNYNTTLSSIMEFVTDSDSNTVSVTFDSNERFKYSSELVAGNWKDFDFSELVGSEKALVIFLATSDHPLYSNVMYFRQNDDDITFSLYNEALNYGSSHGRSYSSDINNMYVCITDDNGVIQGACKEACTVTLYPIFYVKAFS